jgi:hypothetical protein
MDFGILWRRLLRLGKQKTFIVVPQILRQKVIAETHGDVLTGHESTNQTKRKNNIILLVARPFFQLLCGCNDIIVGTQELK